MAISPSEWKWFGHAGHLAIRQWCRFHLCTQVGSYLISTVGDYVPSYKSTNSVDATCEDIAPGRKYETMAFVAGTPCDSHKCGCGMPGLGDDGKELEMRPTNTAREASVHHMTMCEQYAEMDKDKDRERELAGELLPDLIAKGPRVPVYLLRQCYGRRDYGGVFCTPDKAWAYADKHGGRDAFSFDEFFLDEGSAILEAMDKKPDAETEDG